MLQKYCLIIHHNRGSYFIKSVTQVKQDKVERRYTIIETAKWARGHPAGNIPS